ncbi:zinc-binding dehydrogenase [Nocardia gamkensis]|uniref:zinc-binding dehydrogenase n=1 Tax=Nocardia gamkensis TaxID=352869 RepID=UPI0037C8ABFF
MRAVVVDSNTPSRLVLGEAPDPGPTPSQTLVRVTHSSLNPAELYFAQHVEAGTVLGFDAAGIVVEAARDGSGPAVGNRIVSYGDRGGWAELRAVDTRDVAIVPDEVDLGVAATLPVAAGTALRALEQAGPLLGRRVLITGASGGVGGFAVQLAAHAGARVVAVAGPDADHAGLLKMGAESVVTGLADLKPVDIVVDMVGGEQLAQAYRLLAPGGSLQSVGWASGQPAVLPVGSTLGYPRPISITSVYNGSGLDDRQRQLEILLGLVATGALRPSIAWRDSWTQMHAAVEAFNARKLRGKAVFEIA